MLSRTQTALLNLIEFFDIYQLCDAQQLLQSAFTAATLQTCWKQDAPYQLIFFMEQLTALSDAAYVLVKQPQPAAIITIPATGPDITQPANYMYRRIRSNAWQSLPRYISAKQYGNPYKALKQFTKTSYKLHWQEHIKELLEYALSNATIDESWGCHNLLQRQTLLLRLTEAMHLILLRTCNPA